MTLIQDEQDTAIKRGARHSKRDQEILKGVKKSASEIVKAAIDLGADEDDVEDAMEDAVENESDEGEAPYKSASLVDRASKVHEAWNRMYPQPSLGDHAQATPTTLPYVMDVYDKYAIVCQGDEHYKVNYSVTDDGVEFATRDTWQKVEREWVAKSLKAVRLKSIDENTAVVAGYGVVFGGLDLTGEAFAPDTDFDLDYVPRKRVYYDHALEEVKHALGEVISVKVDDIGLWIEAQLDRSKDYVEAVLRLVEKGVLGWSSGSVPHLVHREGKTIKKWTVVEFSLTPTPAEPRTVGVERIKSEAPPTIINNYYGVLSAQDPAPTIVSTTGTTATVTYPSISFPQTDTPSPATSAPVKSDPTPPQDTPSQEQSMTVDNTELLAQMQAQMAATKAQNDAISEILKRFETEPAIRSAGLVTEDGGKADANIKSFADFLLAVQRKDNVRLSSVYKTSTAATKAALSGDSGVTGGYLVPDEFSNRLMEVAGEDSIVRTRAFKYPLKTRNATIPALDQTFTPSGENSAFLGGVSATWTEEAGTLTETEPTFENVELTAWKLGGYALASSEVQADSAIALEALLTRLFGNAIGYHEDYAFLRGNGVAKPLGALVAPCAKSVTRATATEFNLVDAAKMLAGLPAQSMRKAVWLMSQSLIPQLVQMDDGTNVVWIPNAREATPMTLHGLPILFTEKLPALGTARDVALCDFSYYIVADRQPISIAFSEHFRFTNDQTTWRFSTRVGGQPWLKSVITLNDGTTTISPFVYLT